MSWGLPPPPSEAELAQHVPSLAPAAGGAARPRWSVMIPNYNSAHYLTRALTSVLQQDPGAETMQIHVVDDCSTADDPAAVAQDVGRGRVTLGRNPRNLGPTATFNACLAAATGEWIHLLHSDDLILAGFYEACERIFTARRDIVMVTGQVIMIDEHERWTTLTGPSAEWVDREYTSFLADQAVAQRVQFAGTVVRRDAFERAGGFCTLFGHVADWDMWFRIGLLGPVWCTSRPFGLYRVHAGADTGRHVQTGANVSEAARLVQVNLRRLGKSLPGPELSIWRRKTARRAYRSARKLFAQDARGGASAQARWAARLHPSPKHLSYLALCQMRARWAGWRSGKTLG